MREIRKMSDSILPYIKFREEVASDCAGGKLPMLDFTVWKVEERDDSRKAGKKIEIDYEFYEKPMASKLVVMQRSAVPHKIKINTLSQEVIRRMRNTRRTVGKKRRAEIMTTFMKKLKRSGYSSKTRRNVALAGMKGYLNMVKEEQAGGRRVNRPRWEGAKSRRIKKISAKSNWFRRKRKSGAGTATGNTVIKDRKKEGNSRKVVCEKDQEIETVLFVPHTPDGELARLLQEADDRFTKGKEIVRMI